MNSREEPTDVGRPIGLGIGAGLPTLPVPVCGVTHVRWPAFSGPGA
ncbi:MAG: hypothetical protein IPK20_25260 [Betaproteobacteria bacterium]|nr:hypothetical protein [Betaproteobacteria bacterium]